MWSALAPALYKHVSISELFCAQESSDMVFRLTFPGDEKEHSPDLGTSFRAAPSLEMQRVAVLNNTELMGTANGKPWGALIEHPQQEVGRFICCVPVDGQRNLIIVERSAVISNETSDEP